MSELVVPEIEGLQSQRGFSVVKHFAGNDQEYGRTGVNPEFAGIEERITEKARNEIYFPQLKAAVERAHTGGIMCAYVQINGQYSCNNSELLGHLRQWGFDGYVVPDAGFAQRSVLAAAMAGVDGVAPARQVKTRVPWIEHYEQVTKKVSPTYRYFGISRVTFYRWYRRYMGAGVEGLKPKTLRLGSEVIYRAAMRV
jgi:beta-glucosidase-like glycosyl hydrolase